MSRGRCDLALYIWTSYIYIYTSLYVLLKVLKSNYKKRHLMILSWPRSSICWAWAEVGTCIWAWAWAFSIMGLGLFHHPLPLEKDLSSNPMLLLHHHYVDGCGWMVSIIPSFLRGFILRSTSLILNNNLIPVLLTSLVLQNQMCISGSHQTKQMSWFEQLYKNQSY